MLLDTYRWGDWSYQTDKIANLDVGDEAPIPKFTKSGKGRGGAERLQGWTPEGLHRFNTLLAMVKQNRAHKDAKLFDNWLAGTGEKSDEKALAPSKKRVVPLNTLDELLTLDRRIVQSIGLSIDEVQERVKQRRLGGIQKQTLL